VARFGIGAGRRLVAGVPLFWLLLLFLIPFVIVFKISFSEVRLAMPTTPFCSRIRCTWTPTCTR
jgi:putrescine transport system permease protein